MKALPMTNDRLRLITLCVLMLFAFGLLIAWPIQALDYDLFYHLSGGRYFYEHLRPPTTPYFSYLPQKGAWIDYYWGFQVILYTLYKIGGFTAFVVMRAVIYAGLAFLFFTFFDKAAGREKNSSIFVVTLFSIFYLAALFDRTLLVRPHIFTYSSMIVMLSIIEYKRSLAWLLPVVALLWCNIHGVEYPILWLICGAYLIEGFGARILHRREPEGFKQLRWPLIVSVCMPIVNPGGVQMMLKPFYSPVLQETIIKELMPLDFGTLWQFVFAPIARIPLTLIRILVVFLLFSGPVFLWRKRPFRISKLILYLGALYLLFQAYRFTVEFVLLTLPLAKDACFAMSRSLRELSWKKTGAVCAILILLWGTVVVAYMGPKPRFPASDGVVPVGTANFLKRELPQGRIIGDIDCNGYLLWRLYPGYKVPMDLETMLFTPFDLWLVYNAIYNKDLFEKYLKQFSPDVIVVVIGRLVALQTVAQFPQFVPVFIDAGSVLFVDSTKHPELAKKFRIQYLPLAHPEDADFDNMTQEQRMGAQEELLRMLAYHPTDLLLNVAMARLQLVMKDLAKSAQYADVAVKNAPESPLGYMVKGLIALARGDYKESVVQNQLALDRTPAQNNRVLVRRLAAAYMKLGDYKTAYTMLRDTINPMYWDTAPVELAEMGKAALAAGKPCEALVLLDAAVAKAPENQTAFIEDVRKTRSEISQKTHDSCGSTW